MQLIFLGKDSDNGNSPTLYATDQDSYVIQGYVVTDDEILAKLDVPDRETLVEVYAHLFTHLANDGVAGTIASWRRPIVHVKEDGNYIVQGVRLADAGARTALLDRPDPERPASR